MRCDYDGAELIAPSLAGRAALLSLRGARVERPTAAEGATIDASLLQGATLIEPQLEALRWSGCGLQEARVEGGALGRLSLCDLVGARLSGARISEALACDFQPRAPGAL
ncbi:MAG: hypothetical protein H6740_05465 [Alphaproteobacteria bacterium]|nr:hypothetical protein [Alphaproteobacteria bacterium]